MDGQIPMITARRVGGAKTGCASDFLDDLPDLDRRQFTSSILWKPGNRQAVAHV